MIKKINLNNLVVFLSSVILLASAQMSFADGDSFTLNIPNSQGGYTAVVIQQSGRGYLGPQGEYYSEFPTVAQLQVVYGTGTPNITTTSGTGDDQSSSTIEVTVEPPALPDYDQPEAPGPDYIWTPGYWAYDSFLQDYYWVPGTWTLPPTPGYLWTPGYWYWRDGHYIFSRGYWGIHVGFYGGICYGYGYEGRGYRRGDHKWHRRDHDESYNGGPRGTKDHPRHDEEEAMKERHVLATPEQRQHFHAALKDPELRASVNHGRPAIAATSRPGVFNGRDIVVAKPSGDFYNKTKSVRQNRVTAVSPAFEERFPKRTVDHKPILEKIGHKFTPPNQDNTNNKDSQKSN